MDRKQVYRLSYYRNTLYTSPRSPIYPQIATSRYLLERASINYSRLLIR
jgi:hypothetical protein